MKKGFTLIELLAVIVVLAVILAIAIPGISGLISNSTKNAFQSDAKMLLKAVDYKLLEDSSYDITNISATNIESVLKMPANNYQTITITTINGKPYIVIEGKNKWSNLVAYGSYPSISVSDNSNYTTIINQLGYSLSKGVNVPKLAIGMTPIKWNGTSWVDTTENDSAWYNYDTTNKKWANARTVDGSMWVWIPRYIYKISSGWHTNTAGTIDIQFSKGIDDNWNNASIGNIDTGTTANASNNTWTNHPAFTFGSTELTGLWIAKFEATAFEGVANGYTSDNSCSVVGDNVATKTIKILPNVQSWRCIEPSNVFIAIRNMETNSTYGWTTASGLQANGSFTTDSNGIDTHMIKNTEWGLVTYLSKSNYGKGVNEIYINNNQNYITGCAGNTVSAAGYNGCQNTYESTGGVKASTTGNIYGIYDLSGSAWERVSAYVNNGNSNLNGSIVSADGKYKNMYTVGATDDQPSNYALTVDFKGDAIYETSSTHTGSTSWFTDLSNMPVFSSMWFFRGGSWAEGSTAGTYNFRYTYGAAFSNIGFRPMLAVSAGL